MVVWSAFRFNCGREMANRFAIAPLTTDLLMKTVRLPKTNSSLFDGCTNPKTATQLPNTSCIHRTSVGSGTTVREESSKRWS